MIVKVLLRISQVYSGVTSETVLPTDFFLQYNRSHNRLVQRQFRSGTQSIFS